MTERPRPGGPASPGDELARVTMGVEVFLAQPQHLLRTRIVGADRTIGRCRFEMCIEQRPQRAVAIRPRVFGDAVIHIAGFALLGDETSVFQQSKVPRHIGLRHAEDARQLGDVEAVPGENAEQSQSRRVGEKTKKRRRLLHIYKSTYIDTACLLYT